jgi:uncharacterized membrane protein (DUF485 family)
MSESTNFPTPEQPELQPLPEDELETPEIVEMMQQMEQIFEDHPIGPETAQRIRQRLTEEWQTLHNQKAALPFWKRLLGQTAEWQPQTQVRQTFALRLVVLAILISALVLIAFPNSSITPGAAGAQATTIGLVVTVGALLGLLILWMFRKR